MRLLAEDTVGVIIDFQDRLVPHMQKKEELIKNTSTLIKGLRHLEIPLLVTQQYTRGLGPTVPELVEALGCSSAEELPYIEKGTFSCADDPAFMEKLKETGRKNVLICGIEGHVCVLQTITDLCAEGYNVNAVVDCISSRKEQDYKTGIERYKFEGAMVSVYESVLFELTRTSKSPYFKGISALVK